MNRLRILLLLAVLALIVALVPAASAQDQTFGLTQEEYDALVAANDNTASATSYDYNLALNLNLAAAGEAVVADLQGTGSVNEGFSIALTGTVSAEGDSMPIQLDVMYVGDALYVSMDGGATWYGSTAEELGQMVTGMAGGMLPVDPSELATGDLTGMGDMSNMLSGLENLDPSQFISIKAAADGSTTVYTLTLDLGTMLNTPEISGLLGAAMASSGSMGTMSATPSPQEAAMMGQMIGSMFATATATVTQTIDTAAQLVSSTVVNLSIPMDAMGSAGDAIALSLDLSYSNYNAAAPIVAPASFEPLSTLLGGMMGGM